MHTTTSLHNSHELSAFWPASCHIIGKDITWFHCVIWPCMLKSAGLALPKAVFAHGFISGSDGRKMSKSLGNVVDPHELCESYPVDSFRSEYHLSLSFIVLLYRCTFIILIMLGLVTSHVR
jgi:methionyl-tRNA synthetase